MERSHYAKDKPCIFPFTFRNVTYRGCARDKHGDWCATKVSKTGHYVNKNRGLCNPSCPLSGNNKKDNKWLK